MIAYAYHLSPGRAAAQELTRKQAESPAGGLTFLAFVMLRNSLKPDAQSTVAQLTAAAYPCLMLTGNPAQILTRSNPNPTQATTLSRPSVLRVSAAF